MSAKILVLNGRCIYFFISFKSAFEASKSYDNFHVYQYSDLSLYLLAEYDALNIKRPHFTDWNGTLFVYNRNDSDVSIEWRKDFIQKIKKVEN